LQRNVPGVTKADHDFCHEAWRISVGFSRCVRHTPPGSSSRKGRDRSVQSRLLLPAAGMILVAVEVKCIDVNRIDHSHPF
jgi:hypothetical protein